MNRRMTAVPDNRRCQAAHHRRYRRTARYRPALRSRARIARATPSAQALIAPTGIDFRVQGKRDAMEFAAGWNINGSRYYNPRRLPHAVLPHQFRQRVLRPLLLVPRPPACTSPATMPPSHWGSATSWAWNTCSEAPR
jgi:hypothetical protein